MKLNPLASKFWLAMAVTAASLGLASTASATTPVEPGSGSVTTLTADAPATRTETPATCQPKISASSQLKPTVRSSG